MQQEYIVKRYVDQLVMNLKGMAEKDEEVNMVNWLNFTTVSRDSPCCQVEH